MKPCALTSAIIAFLQIYSSIRALGNNVRRWIMSDTAITMIYSMHIQISYLDNKNISRLVHAAGAARAAILIGNSFFDMKFLQYDVLFLS